ncbi:helix-turn-helix transcriptional regulator [Legionella sp. CNM-1927-20]|uniref:helix-turn-helix transcriptional regulator n=1 Tax=Legionella sp. CNM-1927-20 TaxID=3422221 RepID=UPI00403AA846
MPQELKQVLLYITNVEQMTGRNRLTLRRWWNKGIFPRPSKINSVLVWRTEVIEQWIKRNI